MVRTAHFYCMSTISIPGQEAKILQTTQHSQKKNVKEKINKKFYGKWKSDRKNQKKLHGVLTEKNKGERILSRHNKKPRNKDGKKLSF